MTLYGLAMFVLGLVAGAALTGLAVAYFVYRTLKRDALKAYQAQQLRRTEQPWWVQDVTDGALVMQGYEDVKQ